MDNMSVTGKDCKVITLRFDQYVAQCKVSDTDDVAMVSQIYKRLQIRFQNARTGVNNAIYTGATGRSGAVACQSLQAPPMFPVSCQPSP
jgi:hypothetical protein